MLGALACILPKLVQRLVTTLTLGQKLPVVPSLGGGSWDKTLLRPLNLGFQPSSPFLCWAPGWPTMPHGEQRRTRLQPDGFVCAAVTAPTTQPCRSPYPVTRLRARPLHQPHSQKRQSQNSKVTPRNLRVGFAVPPRQRNGVASEHPHRNFF